MRSLWLPLPSDFWWRTTDEGVQPIVLIHQEFGGFRLDLFGVLLEKALDLYLGFEHPQGGIGKNGETASKVLS